MDGRATAAGYVLAGGKSSRMGRDKALLELGGETLVERALRGLGKVCAEVAIAGGGAELRRFGRVIADGTPGCGPLGGIVSALGQTEFEWNAFLAVDVPFVSETVWWQLLEIAFRGRAVAVMPRAGGRVQPLCAVYSRGALGVLREELRAGRWKVFTAVEAAGRVEFLEFADAAMFVNWNSPGDVKG